MSAVLALAPILKIRTVARERVRRAPTARPDNVESITDHLVLGWAEEAVRRQRGAGQRLAALGEQIEDLALLARAVVVGSESLPAEAPGRSLHSLMLFSKLEAARGLLKQAQALVALACLAILVGLAVQLPGEDEQAMRRAPRAVRVRSGGARRVEGAAP